MKICPTCRDSFKPDYASKRYCSRQCWLRHYNVDDREHGLNGARAAGAMQITRRGDGDRSYVKYFGQHEHRVIAERVLKRELLPGEVVHHEDRNKKNNDVTNLIVFASQADHMRHHNVCINQSRPCTCACIRLSEEVVPE